MDCRPCCGACCIAPSISSLGKPAGVRCRHLTPRLRCALWGYPERPSCCTGLTPSPEICGTARGEALALLTALEAQTCPPCRPG